MKRLPNQQQPKQLTLVKADAICELFDIKLWRLYELCRLNLIPHVCIGKRGYRFDRTAIEEWVHSGGTKRLD